MKPNNTTFTRYPCYCGHGYTDHLFIGWLSCGKDACTCGMFVLDESHTVSPEMNKRLKTMWEDSRTKALT